MAARVDTRQVKDAIYRKIGLEKGTDYFTQLGRFLNLKLNKVEFDRSCIGIIGRENLYLHNLLIRSIIRNARIPQKEARKAEELNVMVANCVKKTHLQPQRRSSLSKDRKGKERLSPLGPLGKSPSLTYEETVSRLQEQQSGAEEGEEVEQSAGRWGPHRWKSVTTPVDVSHNTGGDCGGLLGPLAKSPSLTYEETVSRLQEQQSGAEESEEVKQSARIWRPHWWKSVTAPVDISHNTGGDHGGLLGPLGKSPSLTYEETVSRLQEQESGVEEVERFAGIWGPHWWKSVTAPVGVSHNTGGDCGGLRSNKRCFTETCQSSTELPDTNSLGRRLMRKLGEDGVGISRDGANLLNRSLDVYLKKIISQCVGVAGARGGDPFNGEGASGFIEISPGQYVEMPTQQNCVSLLDFCVAMESNPSVLGEGWPLHLEKIRNYPFQ